MLSHLNRLLEARNEFPLFFKKAKAKPNEKRQTVGRIFSAASRAPLQATQTTSSSARLVD